MAKRRPEADDLLRMAEHRRKMQALGRVAETAGRVASSGELRHLRTVPPAPGGAGDLDGTGDLGGTDPDAGGAPGVPGPRAFDDRVVVSLAAARARRAGHPAGSGRTR